MLQDNTIPLPGRMTITVHTIGDTTIIAVAGELDAAVADDLRRHLLAGVASSSALIVDLTAVTFCSAGTLRILLDVTGAARSAGASCAMVSDHWIVLRAITACGFESRLAVHPTLGAALSWLSGEAPTIVLRA
ncbi:STAS domain-containing protein [Amycolatopsis sp., V23-08]|uniref:STAS domain-containing protein n=1 Tax=Amycolatopsis heterodermiae TaxID=3110235 RepID=A0ABU5RLH2_9PSEU|nr:STAS domain-containing protein [Amycolatopsis sp., V23-08]MEA5367138.1 STAS domain-containing protein [Amycolatopsis sp., V23-08]